MALTPGLSRLSNRLKCGRQRIAPQIFRQDALFASEPDLNQCFQESVENPST
jgi:hypothetical protein